ncbi:MAG: hypothetical protein KGN84_21380 [Acidobacteriota bacterium]|nr:hypothetical protein [Acidobacteriota bacterium]
MIFRLTVAAALILCLNAEARVTRIVIEKRESPAYGGKSFGAAGPFETVSGHFYGELDPKDPHNAIVTDLQLAPRNSRGMVEYSGTFALAKPIDMSKSNAVLYYSVPNRGNGAPSGSDDGRVTVVSGWQGDVVPRPGLQTIEVPIAKNPDGSSITGPVEERLIDAKPGTNTIELAPQQYVGLVYQKPFTLDTSAAKLMRRSSRTAKAAAVPAAEWAFADCTSKPFPGEPNPGKICAKNGFDPASEYTLIYTAKDPLVLGIGFAATRDLNSFLRYDNSADNPLAGKIKWAISQGNSQSGNFIRTFINLGFNQDESNRIVWDGANPHIAARQLALNFRFAVAGGAAGPDQPGSEAVLWWSDYADKTRHRATAGLLDRCKATNTCPKIFETFGALEFWYLRESPNLVGTDARADIPLPSNVRRYFFPGTGHGGGRGGFSAEAPAAPRGCVLPYNPNPESDTMRALTADLIDWVSKGTEPPPSRYPRLDRSQLAPKIAFPKIPGVASPNGLANAVYDFDFGPEFHYNDLSGVITKIPPSVKQMLPTLVPKVDADGTDVGGVPSVLHQAPLGSYFGWNVTASGFDKGTICGLAGSYWPFAKTKAERVTKGDPRLSLEERYKNHRGYVDAVRKAAGEAVAGRFLLKEDADKLIAEAEASDVLR